MTPNPDPFVRLFQFTVASATLAGVFSWLRSGSDEEDAVYAEAADVVLDAVSDADATRTVDCRTGRNWRDQVTVEDVIDLNEERELRRWPWRN